jgi:hypothetical protein
VYALAASDGTLFAGGDFTTVDDQGQNYDKEANYIAQWNGSSWSPVGNVLAGAYAAVNALAVSGGTLYVGGGFTTAGGDPANYIAQWNGSNWSPLANGMSGGNLNVSYQTYVSALAVSGGTLYACGNFTNAGGNPANYIAQWNGSNWLSLGEGMSGGAVDEFGNYYTSVSALAVSSGTLYAGGSFTTAGGNAANYIAQWDGSSWSPLGSGIIGWVYALTVSGGTLYAGGYFGQAGGNAANSIAQWNGTNWSPLGSGLHGTVDALAVSGGMLYAGGSFTTAGGNAANAIAQWNGTNWSALGSGMNNNVLALAVSEDTLYAGGCFTTAGDGTNANYIAQWDGHSWLPLGSGMGEGNPTFFTPTGWNTSVNALAVLGGTLYAGGNFTTAGTTISCYVAEANIGTSSSVTPLAIATTNSLFGFNNRQFQFTVAGPVGSNAVVQASTNLQTWIPLVTNPLNLGSFTFTDMLATNYPKRFYRAQMFP